MSDKIHSFTGKYRFLSNFWPCRVWLDGIEYSTVEHAYQAAKTFDRAARHAIRGAEKPGQAKRLGRSVRLRADWQDVKDSVMSDLVRQKFMADDLRGELLATLNSELIEGNHWGDFYWGVCNGFGKNKLGQILMQVRDELRERHAQRKGGSE